MSLVAATAVFRYCMADGVDPATTSFRPFRSIQFTATRRSAGPMTCGTWRTSHSTVSTGSTASWSCSLRWMTAA
jgi:hypothetical protein